MTGEEADAFSRAPVPSTFRVGESSRSSVCTRSFSVPKRFTFQAYSRPAETLKRGAFGSGFLL